MSNRRHPLAHSPSLFQPPLSRSSQSAPNTQTFSPNRPPLFSSKSESRYPASTQNPGRRPSHFPTSPSPAKQYSQQRSASVNTDAAKEEKKSSVTNLSSHISSFVSLSSQLSLQVAQTVVSDLMPSPKVCSSSSSSSSMHPNTILDTILSKISSNMKEDDSVHTPLGGMTLFGLRLHDGKMSGLQNLSRWGDADLITK